MKICSKCKLEKSIVEFNRDASRKDRLYLYCKSCVKKSEQIYYNKNRIKKIAADKKYKSKKRKIDVIYRLTCNLRNRLYVAIHGNYKSGSAVRDLDCSIEFLKHYIELKFYGNMTWDNWGEVWELDHIVPLSKFDLTDRTQLLKAVHYTNLQPLTIEDHRKKTSNEHV